MPTAASPGSLLIYIPETVSATEARNKQVQMRSEVTYSSLQYIFLGCILSLYTIVPSSTIRQPNF